MTAADQWKSQTSSLHTPCCFSVELSQDKQDCDLLSLLCGKVLIELCYLSQSCSYQRDNVKKSMHKGKCIYDYMGNPGEGDKNVNLKCYYPYPSSSAQLLLTPTVLNSIVPLWQSFSCCHPFIVNQYIPIKNLKIFLHQSYSCDVSLSLYLKSPLIRLITLFIQVLFSHFSPPVD